MYRQFTRNFIAVILIGLSSYAKANLDYIESEFDQEISEVEFTLGVSAAYRSQLLLVRDQGEIIKTKYSVIILHGLFNSPQQMDHIAKETYGQGYNTFNLRLPGHFEKDRENLDKVKYQDFLELARIVVPMAKELGDEIIFIGHSTGGLTAIYSAMENENYVAGLILFSLPLKLQNSIETTVNVTNSLGVSGWLLDFFKNVFDLPLGRYFSSAAGMEVKKMADNLSRLKGFETDDYQEKFGFMRQKLQDVPMLWVHTEDDLIVDYSYVRDIGLNMPSVSHYLISGDKDISHNESSGTIEPGDDDETIETKYEMNQVWKTFFNQLTSTTKDVP